MRRVLLLGSRSRVGELLHASCLAAGIEVVTAGRRTPCLPTVAHAHVDVDDPATWSADLWEDLARTHPCDAMVLLVDSPRHAGRRVGEAGMKTLRAARAAHPHPPLIVALGSIAELRGGNDAYACDKALLRESFEREGHPDLMVRLTIVGRPGEQPSSGRTAMRLVAWLLPLLASRVVLSWHERDELGDELRELISSCESEHPARPVDAFLPTHQAPISVLVGTARRRGLAEPVVWPLVALLRYSRHPLASRIGRWAAIGSGRVANYYLFPPARTTREGEA